MFSTENDRDIAYIAEAVTRAMSEGKRLRIQVAGDTLKFKVGEGMWSAPLHSTPDPYTVSR